MMELKRDLIVRKTENEKVTENKIQSPTVSTPREATKEVGKQERYKMKREDIMRTRKNVCQYNIENTDTA